LSAVAHPLRKAREERDGMTQTKLAEVTGLDRATVYRTERGKEPLVTTAIKLARGVGKSVEELWDADS